MEEPGNQDDDKVDSAESERSHAGSIPGVVDDGGVSENDGDEDDAEDDDDEESGDGDEVEGEDWETDDEDGADGSEGDDDEDEDDEEDHMLEASDSDIEEGERCPICLNRFREQDVGTPESCDHMFCLECIQEWAKNMNTCPSDRQVFRLILCRHCGEDRIYKKIPVEDRKAQEEEEEEEEPTYCEVCRHCDREDRLLLCDGCDLGYHLECLTPPLSDIPLDEWFCPECATRHVTEEQENEDEEEEVIPHAASHRPRRQIPRTLAFERVRSAIEEIRVRRTRSIRRIVSSSEEEEEEMCNSASAAPSASPVVKSSPKKRPVKRKKTPRKYRKRKTTKKTTKKKTKRKTKRKTKGKKGRKKKRSVRTARPSSTVKTRIAGALGLSNPPAGRTIPLQKSKPDKTLDMKKSDIGAAQLSIFGNREELIHFDDEYGAPSTSETPSTSATRVTKYSRLALSSYKPIGRVPTMPVMREKTKQIVIKTTPASSSCDLLGSIMQDQSKLHLDSKHVTIKRDGSLSAKPKDITKKVDVKRGEVRNKSEAAEVTSLFRSSFTAVDKTESSSSVLSSLSAAKETGVPGDGAVDEEYDPAHPTDEMEYNSGKTVKDHTAQEQDSHEDEYDPAHPTDADCDEDDNDDVYSGDDSNGVALETQTDNHEEMESEEGGDEMKDVENDIVDYNLSKCNDDSGNSKNDEDCSTKEKHVDSISSGSEKSGICDVSDSKNTEKKLSEGKKELASNVNKCENIFDTTNKESSTYQQNIKTKSVKSESSYKDKKQGDSITQVVSNEKNAAKVDVSPSKDKTLNDNKDVNVKKISPSVKITESSKKVSLKPFEISKKTLVEKRRLYGGEIDFTEDVGFSEGGFPENFEVKIKRIEEVFKDTKKPDEAVLKDSKKPDEAEKEHKSKDKEKTIFPITKQVDQKKKGLKSEDLMKLSGKFKPISGKVESTEKEKVTVSERFKMISDDAKDIEIITIDDEEDPIHEMRKLDKELDLELENPDVGKRKEMDKSSRNERDRDQKKSKRKVSIEGGEFDKGKYRRELKDSRKNDSDNRKQNWEEIEEGEVEDEHRYREKKKKEKKKRSKIDKYYDDENVEKNSDDTRIVIQVSQNTENRTVWEEDEKLKKKRDKEERRRDKDKKERKHRRHRSRSRSYERRDRSRSRERRRSRSRSRDRSRRKRRDRSKSRSRDRSLERSHKKKKKERERSREREKSRSRERDRSREWSRDKSRDREREKNKSREKSLEKVDIFGRSQRRDILKEKENVILPQPKISAFKSHHLDDRLAEIFPAKRQKMEEVSPVSNTKAAKNAHLRPSKIETVSNIAVKEGNHRTYNEMEEKEDEFDDEPEETEQFQYTDRDEYLSQNKHKQQHTNLITIGVNGSDYDPANPTESSSPAPPPLPELVAAPTPPLPPVGDFTQFPPPPPGPPPPGPPPPGMILQDHPPVPIQVSGPPGQAILGDGPPILIQGPPPPLERPPPGMIQHRPNITLPMNLNVLPPGFHQGLPQSLPPPQRQLITVSPFRPGMPPRMHRLPSPGGPQFGGWQVTPTTEVIPSQFDSRVQSPARLPGPPLINGPFDGLPPPQTDGPPPPHNLPPGHPQFEQLQHVIPIQTDGPPPNVVQIPIDVEDPGLGQPPRQMPPPGHESQIVHLGPHPHDPQPRLPIPLLPTTEPPPISVMVSLPPPNSSLMSVPPPTLINISNSMNNAFPRTGTPPVSISPILGHPRITTPPTSMTAIPGLDMVEISSMATDGAARSVSSSNPEETLSQLEEISKLLNTQAKLMLASKDKKTDSSKLADGLVSSSNDADVFKVPLPPGGKSVGSKTDTVETTEVVDMDMASPIDEEGNIELPVSPQFDNLIDNTDDWLEEVFNKKSSKTNEKDSERKSDMNNKDSRGAKEKEKEKNSTPTKSKDKDHDKSKEKESPRKSREDRSKRSSKENKPHHHHAHHTRKHKQKFDNDKDNKDLKLKALKDAHLDIDAQEMPSSAVEMTNKEKYLKKLHLQERVVEEVKMAIKPHYSAKRIDKDQYKEILRKAVPKICHSKSGDINPNKIKSLVEAYIEKFNKPGKQLINEEHEKQISPGVKANGERAKPKPAR